MAYLPQSRYWLVTILLWSIFGCAGCKPDLSPIPPLPLQNTPLSVPSTPTRLRTVPQPPPECLAESRVAYQKLENIFNEESDSRDIGALDRKILGTLGLPHYAKWEGNRRTYEWKSPDCSGWYIHASFSANGHSIYTTEIPPPIATIPAQKSEARLRYTLVGHPREIEAIAIAPGRQTLISSSTDGQIHFWQLSDGQHLRMIDSDSFGRGLKVSSDSQRLLTLGFDLAVWDIATGQQIEEWEFTSGGSIQNSFSSDGRLIINAVNEETVNLWSLETRKRVASLSQPRYRFGRVALHPNHRILAEARNGGWGQNQNQIILRDLSSNKKLKTLSGHAYVVRAMEFSPNGEVLATGSVTPLKNISEIKIWNWQKGILMRSLTAQSGGIRSLIFSADGQRLVSGSSNGQIDVWNVSTGERLQTLTGHTSAVISLAFDSTGQSLVSGSEDRSVKVWQLD
jgi:WD40 repeat protein